MAASGTRAMWPGFAVRLALMYSAFLATNGVQLPFFPLWLHAKALDERSIGLVLAIPMVVRVLAIPVATGYADRTGAPRRVIAICAALSAAGLCLVGFSSGAVAIGIAFVIASLGSTPVMPLTETYALRGLAEKGRAYGPVRLWGSAAFIGGTLVAGVAADLFPASELIWLIVVFSLLSVLTALLLEPMHTRPPQDAIGKAPDASVLQNPAFLLIVAAASLIQASHAVYYGFSTLAWTRGGLDSSVIAALWALGVIAEIILFAISARLPPFVTPHVLLCAGAAGGVLRWLAMAADPPAAMLPALQLLHALTFGATHLGTLGLVARHAPPGRAASAQGYLAIGLGLAMAALTALSGWLFAKYGSSAYAAMALAAGAGGACALAANGPRRDPAV